MLKSPLPTCPIFVQVQNMSGKGFSSVTDQVVDRLREGMLEGRWRNTLPGRKRLADDLGCSQGTVEEATQRLEKEGLLVSQGAGRRKLIELSGHTVQPRALRVMILVYEDADREAGYMLKIVHRLQDVGHEAVLSEKTLWDLRMDVKRVARFAEKSRADAWIVMAGSRDILGWFAEQKIPTFALFGRNTQTPLAGMSLRKGDAMIELADRLADQGHRRIVILARAERRKPTPAFLEQLFLDRLHERGIPTGPYNLPDWGDSPKELRKILDSLFRHTPPTALIVDQPSVCVAVLQHFARIGITAPEDISLACTDMSDSFDWCDPSIAHIAWDSRPVIRRVVKWADHISHGKDDHQKSSSRARLILGGTISTARNA